MEDQDLVKAITKALKTFDGFDNISAEQRNGIMNCICSVLPTLFDFDGKATPLLYLLF